MQKDQGWEKNHGIYFFFFQNLVHSLSLAASIIEWLKRPKGKIRRFDSCWMHLERSVQSLLTEFRHLARPYSLWGTSLARERKGVDDWKSRLEIATIVRVGVPLHHLRRGLVLPGWSVGLKPPLDSATKDEITLGFYVPNVLFNKVALTGLFTV